MKALKIVGSLLAVLAAYLLFWPDGMAPVAWTPPPAPKLEGVYAYNDTLKGIQKLAPGFGRGPEGVNVDAVGRVYAGYADGRVVQMSADGSSVLVWADTGGRPLGITFGPNGGLVVADGKKGLLHIGNKARLLVNEADGLPLGFTNDADNARLDANIYFTDSSSKFGYGRHTADLLEHGGNGRLLRYDVNAKETRVLMQGLHFPNGVAVGPDDNYVLVNETGEYRILRYWLKGEKAGTHDVFIDNLPGFPDNLSYNDTDRFWVAIVAPRDAKLDALLPGDFLLRKVLARLPSSLQPQPPKHAFVLGIDFNGKVIANLQYAGDDAYAPITSVRQRGPWLYFGSRSYPAIGRLPLNRVIPQAPAPPPGWETLPAVQVTKPVKSREAEEEEEEEEERERQKKGG